MNAPSEELPNRVHSLAIRQLEGSLSPQERQELTELLRNDAEARRIYLAHMQDSVSLRWMFSGHYDRRLALTLAEHGPEGVRNERRRTAAWIVLTLAASLACIAAWPVFRSNNELPTSADAKVADPVTPPESANHIATVTGLSRMKWAANAVRAPLLSRVAIGQHFEFSQGALEVTFDTGAQVKVFGPAKFEVISPRSICCSRGRVTTLVGESGKGFTIETPKARIVDLGTQFGVDISEKGDTQVVVFQGSVDLTRSDAAADLASNNAEKWTRRLNQGEALMVNNTGKTERLVAVQRGDFFPSNLLELYGRAPHDRVILDVRDNIRDGESTKCYQIVHGGLREDAPCFVDRSHQWNGVDGAGIPQFLLGADYIMPFNADKFIPDLHVDVQVARPSTCYVFFDDNMSPPAWLREEFQDTGLDIAMDSSKTVWHKDHSTAAGPGKSLDFNFSIWSRDIPKAGVVTLGGVDAPEKDTRPRGFNMYGIAVVAK
jgi:hypothetical protein